MAGKRVIVDAHQHLWKVEEADRLVEIADVVGLERFGIVCTTSPEQVNANPPALVCKARNPGRVYALCGLDHSKRMSHGVIDTPTLAEQVDRLIEMGADGMKMIEGKPTTHRYLPVALDEPYFEEFFSRAKQHVHKKGAEGSAKKDEGSAKKPAPKPTEGVKEETKERAPTTRNDR